MHNEPADEQLYRNVLLMMWMYNSLLNKTDSLLHHLAQVMIPE